MMLRNVNALDVFAFSQGQGHLEEENHGDYLCLLCIYACVFVTHHKYIFAKLSRLEAPCGQMNLYYGSSCDLMPPYNFFHL